VFASRVAAMAVAVASAVLCLSPGRAQAGGATAPAFLLFGGTDLWRYGQFLYGGALWSPAGLDSSGFAGIR
jgi:hypothetical protein